MSVVVKNMRDKTFRAYVKGSPEKLAELCIAESLPLNYYDILQEYTECGYRVIALAGRILPLKTTFIQIH
jgi:cation-transporting ATPase 13A2